MGTDWNEARIDRLSERIDRIEEERRAEKLRTLDRWTYAVLAVAWIMATVAIAVAAFKAGAR